jgi:ketosteroid isomerase-like protein
MSQENVQVVKEVVRGFNERDEGVLVHYANDVEFRLYGGFSDMAGQSLKGPAAVLEFAYELVDSLGAEFHIERLVDAGERVVMIASTVGAGAESGAPVSQRWGQVYTFRDGKIAAVDNYWEADEALEAVGLSRLA